MPIVVASGTRTTMPLTYDYYSDPLCIWAFVAQPKLDHVRERWGAHVEVRHRKLQLAIAESVGLARAPFAARLDDGSALAALHEDDAAAKENHVRGSPTYVFDGGRTTLFGNFPAAILDATVEELLRGLGVGASRC